MTPSADETPDRPPDETSGSAPSTPEEAAPAPYQAGVPERGSSATPESTEAEPAEKAERIVFFSDAVVAIAITLLALDLPVPHTTDSTTNGQLLHALGGQWPAYLAFFISFSVIGSHWADHRRLFRHAEHVNAKVNSLNMLWLLMMVLIPFATRLLASDGAFGVRFTIYVLIQIIAVSCQVRASLELRRSRLLRDGAPVAELSHDLVPDLIYIAVFVVSVPVSFATHWAYAVWAAAPLGARGWRAFRLIAGPGEPA
ncbi:MAG TPA: TMEM175 family protein [Trebonia sp.]